MQPSHTTFRIVLLTLLLCVVTHTAKAAQNDNQEQALKAYHESCLLKLNSEDVLRMADTLTQKARLAQNSRFEILAELLRLDYHYFRNDKDQIPDYVERVKRMSRQYDQPQYYYFAWGSRLITFYLKNGMTNHALLEAQNMLREAQAENFQKGIIECYKAMGNIYSIQSNHKLAAEYYAKMIDLVEQHAPDDANLPIYYSSLAESEILNGHFDTTAKMLDKIEEYFAKSDSITPYQRLSLDRSRLKYYLKKGDLTGAQKTYEHIQRLFARNKDLSIHAAALYEAQLSYFMASKQYDKAITVIDSIQQRRPNAEMRTFLLGKKGEICWQRNDRAGAAECFRQYIEITDSVRQISAQESANEIAGLLGLQQLEKEKQQLQVDIQRRRLHTTYWAIALLALALIAGTIAVIRLYRLNRQIEQARRVVIRQNSELQQAKELAEQASVMKSRFIQDISHEVRTPLNAIVGFSHVIGELSSDTDAREYAGIIATNSDDLLRLFNNVLEFTDLDQQKHLAYDILAELNTSCRSSIDRNRVFVQEGVSLTYRTSDEQLQILTNPSYVSRILDNVLHNAAKYTQTGTITLECAASRAEGVIRYWITDTGPGIPAEEQPTIFDQFKKLNTFAQGTGLGLAVSRTIAEKLGGTLTIDSSYTSGCRILLILPLHLPA